MKLRVTVLPGDGIGPEVTRQALAVLQTVSDVCGYDFRFDSYRIGGDAIEQDGTPLPEKTLAACLESDAVLLGAVGARKYDHCTGDMRPEAGLRALRQALGGFANLRPVKAYDAIADCSPLREEVVRGADILIVRELLGGLYFGQPRAIASDGLSAHNTMPHTEDTVRESLGLARGAGARRRAHAALHRPSSGTRSHIAAGVRRTAAGQPPCSPFRFHLRHRRPQYPDHIRRALPHQRPDCRTTDRNPARQLRECRRSVVRCRLGPAGNRARHRAGTRAHPTRHDRGL